MNEKDLMCMGRDVTHLCRCKYDSHSISGDLQPLEQCWQRVPASFGRAVRSEGTQNNETHRMFCCRLGCTPILIFINISKVSCRIIPDWCGLERQNLPHMGFCHCLSHFFTSYLITFVLKLIIFSWLAAILTTANLHDWKINVNENLKTNN